MPLCYLPPQVSALRQGEILGDVYEHVPQFPPIRVEEGQPIPINSIYHEYLVVMSPDCDLEWDFKARYPDPESQERLISLTEISKVSSIIPQVFLAEGYKIERIVAQVARGTDIWRRIEQNQDERYHHLVASPIGTPPIGELPDLYIDFKKSLSIPTQSIYDGIRINGVRRLALIPEIYIHHLMHRYYGFLSRVALPD